MDERQRREAEAGGWAQQGRRHGDQSATTDAAALQRLADELAVVERIVVAGPVPNQASPSVLRSLAAFKEKEPVAYACLPICSAGRTAVNSGSRVTG